MPLLPYRMHVTVDCENEFNRKVRAKWLECSHNLSQLENCLRNLRSSNTNDYLNKMLGNLITSTESECNSYESYSRLPHIKLTIHNDQSAGMVQPNTPPNNSINYGFRAYLSRHDNTTYCLQGFRPSIVVTMGLDDSFFISNIPSLFEATCMGLSYIRTKEKPERGLMCMDIPFNIGEYELTLKW